MIKGIADWFDGLPSPLRHFIVATAASELLLAANALAGATSLADVKVAIGGLLVGLIAGLARAVQQALAGPNPPTPPVTPPLA